MKYYLIIVAAFILLVSCEKKSNSQLYDQAWKEQSVDKALSYSSESNNTEEQAKGFYMAAFLLAKRQSYDSAIGYYHQSIEAYKKAENKEGQIIALHNLGNVHRESSNFLIAIDLYKKAMDLDPSEYLKHRLLLRMAHCNWRIDQWGLANDQLQICKTYFKNDPFLLAETYMIMGNCSFDYGLSSGESKPFDDSFGYFSNASNLYEASSDKAMAYNNIANTYLQIGKYKQARQYLYKAKQLQTDEEQLAIVYHNLGKYHMAMERYDSAILYFNENIAMTGGTTHEAGEGYRRLTDHYILTGQTEKALETNAAYFEMNQRVIEERERLKRAAKEKDYQLSKSHHTIQQQQREISHQFWRDFFIMGFSMGVPGLLSIALLMWIVQHLRNKLRAVEKVIRGV